jgi:hypothetical protein
MSGRSFFTVETLCLKTVHVFFLIEIGTRRIHVVGCTVRRSSPLGYPTGASTGVEATEGRAKDVLCAP